MILARAVLLKVTIFVGVLASAVVFATSGEVSVFKCCAEKNQSSLNNPSSETSSIIIIHKDFNFHKSAIDNLENITNYDATEIKESIISAKQCYHYRERLSATLSLYPNQTDIGFLSNGYIQDGAEVYSPQQYCVDEKETSDTQVSLQVQSSSYCTENTCLRKCCGLLEVYDISTYGKSKILCVPSVDNPWKPSLYSIENKLVEKSALDHSPPLFSSHPRDWCSEDKVLWSRRNIGSLRKSLFRVLNNGSVVIRSGQRWKLLNSSKICIDGAVNIPGYYEPGSKQTSFSGDEMDTIIIECGPELAPPQTDQPTLLYGILLSISSIFLLTTLIIYLLLWDKQGIHGLCLLGYVATMLLFYLSIVAAWFYSHHFKDSHHVNEIDVIASFCGVIGVVTHFLFICSICWLTVTSFDVYSKFRILKLTRARSKNTLKFMIYLLFTLTVPTIIVGTGVILDLLHGDDIEVSIILPRYGWRKCFLDLNSGAGLPYLFGPVGVLLLINCILYLATIFHMYRLQQSTKFASANNNQVRKQRGKVRLYGKLFLLMGISWLFEIISYLAFGTSANVFVIIGDSINILQPILLFIIFVCKKDILKSLCQKYPSLTKIFASYESEDLNSSTASRGPRLNMLWHPSSTTSWFRSRLNSTMTDTSNISSLSIKSTLGENIDGAITPTSSSLNINQEES